jgi:DNA mismatch repair ATPase MutL
MTPHLTHFGHLYNQLNRMQEQVNYLIAQQQNHFSCATSLGGSFTFEEETKQNDHSPQLRSNSNVEQSKPPAKSTATQSKPSAKSRSKSKISKDKKETSPKPSGSKTSDEDKSTATQFKPPAKSQSKSKKKETSPKPRRSKTSDEDQTGVDYYKIFPDKNVANLLLLMLVPMQDSKTVMLSAIQMPSFSALQVVFIYLIFHQVIIIQSLN